MKQFLLIFVIVAVLLVGSFYLDGKYAGRCYKEGESAGKIGAPPESCPYSNGAGFFDRRELWMKGWIKGNFERGEK